MELDLTRKKVTRLTLQMVTCDGELFDIHCKPDELLKTVDTINRMNRNGDYEIHRIYAYGDTQDLLEDNSPRLTYQDVK